MPKLSALPKDHPEYKPAPKANESPMDALVRTGVLAKDIDQSAYTNPAPINIDPINITTAYGDPDDPVAEHMEGVNPAFYEMIEFSIACWTATQIKRIGLNEDLTETECGTLTREFVERVEGLVKVHGLPIMTLGGMPETLAVVTNATAKTKERKRAKAQAGT